MNGTFYIGATGLESEQRALDVIAANIANMNTPAFKRSEVSFAELVGQGQAEADPALAMNGVSMDTTQRVYDQGELKTTGRAMDLAIDGDGFIELVGEDGKTRLWRGGTLAVNTDGVLTGAEGLPLKGMIAVPSDAGPITIDRTGVVSATAADGSQKQLGKIEIVRPQNQQAVSSAGDGIYEIADDSQLMVEDPTDSTSAALVQGSLEGSNVQLTDEMVTLMMMQRAYAANAQVVQAGDQMMQIANGLRR